MECSRDGPRACKVAHNAKKQAWAGGFQVVCNQKWITGGTRFPGNAAGSHYSHFNTRLTACQNFAKTSKPCGAQEPRRRRQGPQGSTLVDQHLVPRASPVCRDISSSATLS